MKCKIHGQPAVPGLVHSRVSYVLKGQTRFLSISTDRKIRSFIVFSKLICPPNKSLSDCHRLFPLANRTQYKLDLNLPLNDGCYITLYNSSETAISKTHLKKAACENKCIHVNVPYTYAIPGFRRGDLVTRAPRTDRIHAGLAQLLCMFRRAATSRIVKIINAPFLE